jgi:hypothetical protein
MSTTEHDEPQQTGKHDSTDRPEGNVDEDANPPLTDPTTTDVDRNPELARPQGTEPAVPPYGERQQSSAEAGTPGRGENEQKSPDSGGAEKPAGKGHERDDPGVGPAHTSGTGRAEDKP